MVCGEALIDVVRDAAGTTRPSPGGGPFNTARALARLGVPVAFLGRLSDDESGRELASLLASDGVSLALASIGHERTTVAVADVDEEGVAEYTFDADGTSAPNLTTAMVPARLASDVRALHVGTLGMVLEPMASTLIEIVEREGQGRFVMLDPNIRSGLIPDDVYRERLSRVIAGSTVVKASDGDMAWLYPGASHGTAAHRLLEAGVHLVVVTVGERGAFAATREHQVSVDAIHVEVADTIGAGDSFGAALLAWLHDHDALEPDLRLEKTELRRALEFACLAAAITCSRVGADPPWRWEISAAT